MNMSIILTIMVCAIAAYAYKQHKAYQLRKDNDVYFVKYIYEYSTEPRNAYNKIQLFANKNKDKIKIIRLKMYTGHEIFPPCQKARIELAYKSLDGKTLIPDDLFRPFL